MCHIIYIIIQHKTHNAIHNIIIYTTNAIVKLNLIIKFK